MKWVKATERLPDQPGQYLFRVLGGGYNDDTAYYVKSISRQALEERLKLVLNPQKHEWLDESETPFIVAEVREYHDQLLREEITFSRFVELLNQRPSLQKQQNKYPILGYAPGNYHCKCCDCGVLYRGDKRSIQCETCAIESLKT